ncbi:MAG: winged helix-turn-helix transcriptional regulator [Thermoplasmata archaeon]
MNINSKKENIRKENKNKTCMISYGKETICIDPSLHIFHILGKKYAIIILTYLGGNKDGKSFNEILMGIPNSSTTIISSRLRELESNRLIKRDTSDGRITYRLTEIGEMIRESLIPLIKTVEINATLFQ